MCSANVNVCKQKFKVQIVHNIHGKSYEELLTVSSDISVHLRILVIEVYKSLMKTNKTLHYTIKHYTIKPITYDLHTGEKLYLSTVSTARYGLNYLIFHGSLLWNNLPTSIKINQSLADFKKNLRHFGKIHCTCVVCR